ncbi:MAG: hypothetical protein M0P71_17555 [Melioribacteraceae bacterium]|nr:hypothetical protein [Melioribacteraceae bacterium]
MEGNILQMPDMVLEILEKKYFIREVSYEGLHRKETSPYPYEAIREVLINAIVHRYYLDSFVFISIYDDKITFWNGGLAVTIFKDRYTEGELEKLGLSERQIKAVLYVKGNGVITNKEYQNVAEVKKTIATAELKFLVDSNILQQDGTKGAGAKYILKKIIGR